MARDLTDDPPDGSAGRTNPASLRDGLASTVGELVERHKLLVYRRALRICRGNATLADEVFQESFVRLFTWLRSHPNAFSPEDFPRLLSAFAARSAVDLMRRERHVASPPPEVAALLEQEAAPDLAWASRADIEGLLKTLDTRSREVIELSYLREMSAADVAAALHISPTHVRVLRHRALRALRRSIEIRDAL